MMNKFKSNNLLEFLIDNAWSCCGFLFANKVATIIEYIILFNVLALSYTESQNLLE